AWGWAFWCGRLARAAEEQGRSRTSQPLEGHRAPGVGSGSVSENHAAGAGRLCLDELEGAVLLDAREERLAAAEEQGVYDQPQLVEQALVEKACHQGWAADDIDVLPRLRLQVSKVLQTPDDLRCWRPQDAVELRGHDVMRRLGGQPGIGDFAVVRSSGSVGRDTRGVGVDRRPVVTVARVHPRALYEGVDVGDQPERVRPRIDPLALASVGSLGEAIQRDLKRGDHLSAHRSRPFPASI